VVRPSTAECRNFGKPDGGGSSGDCQRFGWGVAWAAQLTRCPVPGWIGAVTTEEAIGQGAVQAPLLVRAAATTAGVQVVRMAERVKRLGR
jgi:hypothetical protein